MQSGHHLFVPDDIEIDKDEIFELEMPVDPVAESKEETTEPDVDKEETIEPDVDNMTDEEIRNEFPTSLDSKPNPNHEGYTLVHLQELRLLMPASPGLSFFSQEDAKRIADHINSKSVSTSDNIQLVRNGLWANKYNDLKLVSFFAGFAHHAPGGYDNLLLEIADFAGVEFKSKTKPDLSPRT